MKKSLNCDGQPFQHYQQNEQSPLIEYKKDDSIYHIGNTGPGLGLAQTY